MMAETERGYDSASASDITISDTDLETINTEELATFDSTQTCYSNTTDMMAVYTLGNAVHTTQRDWVGLFKNCWQTIYDFSAYQWVPPGPIDALQPLRHRLVFPRADIQHLVGIFQFLYVTWDHQVLGGSDNFQLCCLDSATSGWASFLPDQLPQSMSLVSLGSLSSSSSDESDRIEIIASVSAEVASKRLEPNPASYADPPFVTVGLPAKNDNWTLSDFVVGNSTRDGLEKLHLENTCLFASTDEKYEPLTQFYLSLRRRDSVLIEELPEESPAPSPASRPAGDTACSDVVVYNKPGPSALSMLSRPSLFLSLWRDAGQLSCLRVYGQHPMEFGLREALTAMSTGSGQLSDSSRPREADSGCSWWMLPDASRQPLGGDARKNIARLPAFTAKTPQSLATEQKMEIEAGGRGGWSTVTQGTAVPPGCGGISRREAGKVAHDLRKKRWVQCSRIKKKRGQHDAMLQEALAFLMVPSSPPSLLTGNTTASTTASTTTSTNASPTASTTTTISASTTASTTATQQGECRVNAHSTQGVVSSRKRHMQTTPGISKFKRRRVAGHKSVPPPAKPCNTEDKPCNTGDKPCNTGDKPYNTGDKPCNTEDKPCNTGDKPCNTGDKPCNTGDKPCNTEDKPCNTGDKPCNTEDKPCNTGDKPCNTEDKDSSSADNEREDKAPRPASENLQLLSLALTEVLKSNAQLRQQMDRAEDSENSGKGQTPSSMAAESRRDRPRPAQAVTADKTMTKEGGRKGSVAPNTTAQRKKYTSSQGPKARTRGKATNTEHNEKRHAASNTTVVAKRESHSQCQATVTAGKSTNTVPAPPRTASHDNSTSTGSSSASRPADRGTAVTPRCKGNTPDLTVHRPTSSRAEPHDPEDSLCKWKVISTRKMRRLHRLIAAKKEELTRLRENAENYERRSRSLETTLQRVRSSLSEETIKRLHAEREVKELRTKFWELLASRRSQPWTGARHMRNKAVVFVDDAKVRQDKPFKFPDPAMFKFPIAVNSPSNQEAHVPEDREAIAGRQGNHSGDSVSLHGAESVVAGDSRKADNGATEKTDRACHGSVKEATPPVLSPSDQIQMAVQVQKGTAGSTGNVTETACGTTEEAHKPADCVSKYDSNEAWRTLPEAKERAKEPICVSPKERAKETVCVSPKERAKEPCVSPKERAKEPICVSPKERAKETICVSPKERAKEPICVSPKERAKEAICVSPKERAKEPICVSPTEARKTTCSAMSLKKFLIPAMTAIAETFSSSKTRHKGVADSNQSTGPPTTHLTGMATTGAVTKVTVSISAEGPSTKPPKHKRKKGSGKVADKTKVDVCTPACPETSAQSNSGVTPRQQSHRKASDPVRVVTSSFLLPLPNTVTAAEHIEAGAEAVDERHRAEQCKEPLHGEYLDMSCRQGAKRDAADSGANFTHIQPVKFCFGDRQPSGVPKPVSYADTARGVSSTLQSPAHIPFSFLWSPPTPGVVTAPPPARQAYLMGRELSVHRTKPALQQQPQPLSSPTARAALPYDPYKARSDAVHRHLAHGQCLTCGMRFSPTVDRHLLEEHIHFHRAFTE